MPRLILTSGFHYVAKELQEKGVLPKGPKRVAFIPTASDVYKEKPWMEQDRESLIDLGYTLADVDLKGKEKEELRSELKASDIIFVAGGNASYLCEYAHQSGFNEIIRDLLDEGRIYIGSSAGSILAGPSVEPWRKEEAEELAQHNVTLHDSGCIGLVDYIVLPHYPRYKEVNDRHEKEFPQFTYVKMTDQEYRVED